ncbi:hypothetical protein V5P93_002543 [Actinokineospora auranticolor]|uniref:Uncharacterized protein n=1 Tax=Actinokineospora auranticolor TaxID=155976 RepID=A0A2S6GMI4_9PSEU|nr:hypothetical protein [Actinokineospora auranticolor]PPK66427.1 hypothetical protein CLV40_110131 [Actinokineospora auranticolor]
MRHISARHGNVTSRAQRNHLVACVRRVLTQGTPHLLADEKQCQVTYQAGDGRTWIMFVRDPGYLDDPASRWGVATVYPWRANRPWLRCTA